VKNAGEYATKLSALLKRVGSASPPPFGPVTFPLAAAASGEAEPAASGEGADAAVRPPDPITVIVTSFLLWESTTHAAVTAFNRILKSMVDFNDLRISLPAESAEILGERYPLALDRCQRLRAVLRDIFHREHAVRLEHLRGEGKRDVRRYVESLEGIVPYVSSRVLLLCFDTHMIPVDEQLRARLVEAGAAAESADVAEVGAYLARHVKSGEGARAHFGLQRWVDQLAGDPSAARRPARAPAPRPSRSRSSSRSSPRR
jgi:hypothetical protein